MAYYYCKVILGAKETVKDLKIKAPSDKNYEGSYLSRQISKANYISMAKRLVAYVEKNKQMPNYISYGKYEVNHKLYTYLFAVALVKSIDTAYLPKEINISTKLFSAKVESSQEVVAYFKKVTGRNYDTVDGVLGYVKAYFNYLMYLDDKV